MSATINKKTRFTENFSVLPIGPASSSDAGAAKKKATLAQSKTPTLLRTREKFKHKGKHADHPYTARIREIKEDLHLPATTFISKFNNYEKEYQAEAMREAEENWRKGPHWRPLNKVQFYSYLQGAVENIEYVEAILKRIESFYKHTKEDVSAPEKVDDLKSQMLDWFERLGIDITKSHPSPFRELARMIAPYYKRPVYAQLEGKFTLGAKLSRREQVFFITDASGVKHDFTLDPSEPLLVEENRNVMHHQIIQYTLQFNENQQPISSHTKFFRWFKQGRKPYSATDIQQVENAVILAAEAVKTKRSGLRA